MGAGTTTSPVGILKTTRAIKLKFQAAFLIPPVDVKGSVDLFVGQCEYNKEVQKCSTEIRGLLRDKFEHSAVSGYGEMHSLETKVDCEVRDAREIPASEFEVKPEFLVHIQKVWGTHFLPRRVRAEPYKIHTYGPGGHFKSHRDTPETGLMGTVGLGDCKSDHSGHFRIGDETLRAETFNWVAFHLDIPHEVTKLEDGYRAVMAFKMFLVTESDSDDTLPAQLEAGEAYDDQYYGDSSTWSRVYPFTGAHVDILLARDVAQAKKAVQWLDGLPEIPFYTWDIGAS